jgi:hypothetical protein
MEYQWRSLQDEVIATGPSTAEARELALRKMPSMGVGMARLYQRSSPEQPWQKAERTSLLEHRRFDRDSRGA